MRIEHDGYCIAYEAGRLADVIVGGQALDCVQVRGYDFPTGAFTEPLPSCEQVKERVRCALAE